MTNFFLEELRKIYGDGRVIHDPQFVGECCYGSLGDLRVKARFAKDIVANQYQFRDNIPAIDILEPCLPQPWIHYLSNGTMHAFVSQTGGGFAWWKDPVMCRLTRYRMFHLPMDRPGFYLYIAEEGQNVFCPTFQPVKEKAERRKCSFSPGMAEYLCSCHGL